MVESGVSHYRWLHKQNTQNIRDGKDIFLPQDAKENILQNLDINYFSRVSFKNAV